MKLHAYANRYNNFSPLFIYGKRNWPYTQNSITLNVVTNNPYRKVLKGVIFQKNHTICELICLWILCQLLEHSWKVYFTRLQCRNLINIIDECRKQYCISLLFVIIIVYDNLFLFINKRYFSIYAVFVGKISVNFFFFIICFQPGHRSWPCYTRFVYFTFLSVIVKFVFCFLSKSQFKCQ